MSAVGSPSFGLQIGEEALIGEPAVGSATLHLRSLRGQVPLRECPEGFQRAREEGGRYRRKAQQGHYRRVDKRRPSGNWAMVVQGLEERGDGFSGGAHDSSGSRP